MAEDQVATDELNNDKLPSKIFQLNINSFEKLFEWMSLNELLALRQTCKRIKQIVNSYIQSNYPKLSILQYTNGICFDELSESDLDFLENLKFQNIQTDELELNQIEKCALILSRLKSIKVNVNERCDLYEALLHRCPNLSSLSISSEGALQKIIGSGIDWLKYQYPALQHFELHVNYEYNEPIDCEEFTSFFQQNPNIQSFCTDAPFLLVNGDSLLKSNIKFDCLCVHIEDDMGSMCELLYSLYEQQFYKRLHICCYSDRKEMQHLHRLRALEKLYLQTFFCLPQNYQLTVMNDLIELSMNYSESLPMEILQLIATNFTNLQRIYIKRGLISDIRTFIRVNVKLKKVVVRELVCGFDIGMKEFLALNRERNALPQATKVTIFIDEKHFLRLKWTAKLNFNLIELKRADSCKTEHYFDES